MRGRDTFKKYKSLIGIIVKFYSLFPICFRKKFLVKCRNCGGKIGLLTRYALLKSLCPSCDDNVVIYQGAYIMNPQTLKIGRNVSVHPMCYIESGNFNEIGITIGNDVSIAHGTSIIATSHNYSGLNQPIKDQGLSFSKIVIEDDVWIGAKVTILSGVTIRKGTIIGANSVVTHDTDMYGIYVGAPAKKIKSRQRV